MQSHELLYDGEPETKATVLPGKGRVRLAEAIKNVRQKCRFNTQSRILYRKFQARCDALDCNVDVTASGSEFDGVGQKVPRYLLKSVIITEDRASGGINQFSQPDPFGVGCRAYRLDSGLDYMREIQTLQVKPDLAGDYAAHFQ